MQQSQSPYHPAQAMRAEAIPLLQTKTRSSEGTSTETMIFQYRAATSQAGYGRIEDVLLLMEHLHNALIQHRESARSSHRRAFSLKVQNAHLADLHRHSPEYHTCARRLLESVAAEFNKSYRSYFKNADVGKPQTASPYRNTTLAISEPANQHLKFDTDGCVDIHVKALPTIKFKPDCRLPHEEQPRVIRITLLPRRFVLSLIYQMAPAEMAQTIHQSVGIDPGVIKNITAVSDDGSVLQLPGFITKEIGKTRRLLKRKMQRQRDAALRDRRARSIKQKDKSGTSKRRFRWNERPSQGYLKTLAQFCRVGEPLVDVERFLDRPPNSRNEALASLMRRFDICEERGTGIDKVVLSVELHQLPAPLFEAPPGSTRTFLFARKPLSAMDRPERVRACYLHACLRYVSNQPMNNASVRERFGIAKQNAATASRFLRDTLDANYIVISNPDAGARNRTYLPFWADDRREIGDRVL